MSFKHLWALILVLNSGVVLAEYETLVFGDYLGKIYGDGSGTLGKRFDPEVTISCKTFSCEYDRKNADENTSFSDTWSFRIKIDEMTDEQQITVRKDAWKINEQFGEMRMDSNIYLWVILNDKNSEVLCVAGHDYPGMTGVIRVDKNPPLETRENGCLELTKDLDDQLRSGSKLTIRGSHLPYRGAETQVIDLGGYSEMSEFLRSRRG